MDNSNVKIIHFSKAINLSMDLKTLHENVLQINFLDYFKLIDESKNIIIHPNFINDELEFKAVFEQRYTYKLDNLTLINPYKFFICDMDLNLAMEDFIVSQSIKNDKTVYVDSLGNTVMVIENEVKYYYNRAGDKVLTISFRDGNYFAECYIDNEYYIFTSELQLMLMVMKILIEREDSNYILFNNNLLQFSTYASHIELWNYDNFKIVTYIDRIIYNKKDPRQFLSGNLKSLFTMNRNVVYVSENQDIVNSHSEVKFLPRVVIMNGGEHSPNNLALVKLWRSILCFSEDRIELLANEQDSKSFWKKSKKKQKENILDVYMEQTAYFVEDIDLNDFTPKSEEVNIVCENPSLLAEARFNSKIRKIIKMLQILDYVLYDNDMYVSKFIKRSKFMENLATTLDENQYIEKEIFWTESNCENPRKIVVVFSSLPGPAAYFNSSMFDRCFNQNYLSIEENILKETLIVRLADINCVYGSYYSNTLNYMDYEDNIAIILEKIRLKYNLNKSDVTLYGDSKGGYGALLHGLKLGYNILASDPIVSMKFYNINNDINYMQSMELQPRIDKISSLLNQELEQKVYVLVSSKGNVQTIENAKIIIDMHHQNSQIQVIDLKMESVKSHPEVTSRSVGIQNALFNKFLLS